MNHLLRNHHLYCNHPNHTHFRYKVFTWVTISLWLSWKTTNNGLKRYKISHTSQLRVSRNQKIKLKDWNFKSIKTIAPFLTRITCSSNQEPPFQISDIGELRLIRGFYISIYSNKSCYQIRTIWRDYYTIDNIFITSSCYAVTDL